MLCEKSRGNIKGVLDLMEAFPIAKIESIYQFWVEITLPLEEREKRMREKADTAAQKAAEELLNAKIKQDDKEDKDLARFLEIYKRKT